MDLGVTHHKGVYFVSSEFFNTHEIIPLPF